MTSSTVSEGSVPSVIAIVGPTGSGKTTLALAVAERLGTDIISADSMQFYRGLAIGTAAPTPEALARVKHHFVGCLDAGGVMDAAMYCTQGRAVVDGLRARGKRALVVGGSGLYVNALLDGIFEGPGRDEVIRERLNAEAVECGNAHMMARLVAVDPAYAATVGSENDLVRIVRALEVYELSGTPYSTLHAEHRAKMEPFSALIVGLEYERSVLYARVEARVEEMFAAGWVAEVEGLLAAGFGDDLARLKPLGYAEIVAHLEGATSLDETKSAIKQQHRRYAKRQLTWFRGDARVQWLKANAGSTMDGLADEVLALGLGVPANTFTTKLTKDTKKMRREN